MPFFSVRGFVSSFDVDRRPPVLKQEADGPYPAQGDDLENTHIAGGPMMMGPMRASNSETVLT
jgi:hypothetical protein